MDKLVLQGGERLRGEIPVSGAKNAALPIICASLLSADPLDVDNVPALQDVATMQRLLAQMGVKVARDGGALRLDAAHVDRPEAPYDLVKTMRASIRCWALCSRASALRGYRGPAAAPSARARSTSTSRDCRRWAPRCASITAISSPLRAA